MEQNNEIDRIQQEIHKLRTVGINADQEDKSPMEEYIDTVTERRMISELEEQIQKIKDRNVPEVSKMLIAEVMEFKGGSEEDYIKWAEQELAKIKISEEDQLRAFSDIINYNKKAWHITSDKIEYIGPYTAKEAQSIMNYRMNGNGANTIEELTVDKIKERYQMDEEEVQKLREIAGEKYKYSSVGVNASRIGSPVADIDSKVDATFKDMSGNIVRPAKFMDRHSITPIYNSLEELQNSIQLAYDEKGSKIQLRLREMLDKLQATISSGKYICDGTI